MRRVYCIPGIFFLVCALVLLIIVSISLPTWTATDIARVHFSGSSSTTSGGSSSIEQLRFGIWAYCTDSSSDGSRTCYDTGHGYSVTVNSPNNGPSETIASSWTRGLAIHPVAAAVTFIALLFSFSTHVTITLISSLLSFLAALITLIAFAVDIALFVYVKHKMGDLTDVSESTKTGPGFWMTFVAFWLLCFAGCTVCFGRRRARMDGASSSYPMTTRKPFWSRFRRTGY